MLIFGGIFFILAMGRMLFYMLFGGPTRQANHQQTRQNAQQRQQTYHRPSSAGNAHHESSHGNSRQRRSNKIFSSDEGEYVDFEEVK